MTLSTQPYKGARDFYPEDKRLQKYIFGIMREVCESFGYTEYDAPILEPTELFLAKGSQEIIDEQTYTFVDRGDRSVTIRTEITPSVSRMVASRRQELGYPVRWYSIPELWRYERMQRGRMRQFWQLNADVFGLEGVEAEHEQIMLADAIMKRFGASANMYSIRVNSRRLMNNLLGQYLELDDATQTTLIRLIDRMKKMDPAEFRVQVEAVFSPSQRSDGGFDKLMQLLEATKLNHLPESIQSSEEVEKLKQLSDLLKASGVENVKYDPTLMRGFDYYTDIVFEVFDENPDNNRSMFGGGRYDGLVGLFGVEPVPTVGFGMGDVTLLNFLESHELLPKLKTETDIAVLLVGSADIYQKSLSIVKDLRDMGVTVSVDPSDRKLDKKIKSAAKQGLTYVIVLGEDEIASEQFTLKNIISGETSSYSLERIVSMVRDRRRS